MESGARLYCASLLFDECVSGLPDDGFVPRALVCCSSHALWSTFRHVLSAVYERLYVGDHVRGWSFMRSLTSLAPLAPGAALACELPSRIGAARRVGHFWGGDARRFPPLDFSLRPLFRLLPLDRILRVLSCLLCEEKVVVHSRHGALRCLCMEALLALLHPFEWPHTYIPTLPLRLLTVCESFMPFFLGIDSADVDALTRVPLDDARIVLVNLDDGLVSLLDAQKARTLHHGRFDEAHPTHQQRLHAEVPDFPHFMARSLRRRLKGALWPEHEALGLAEERAYAPKTPQDRAVRAAFFEAMFDALADLPRYFGARPPESSSSASQQPGKKQDGTQSANVHRQSDLVFDEDGFMASRPEALQPLLRRVTHSMLWSIFTRELRAKAHAPHLLEDYAALFTSRPSAKQQKEFLLARFAPPDGATFRAENVSAEDADVARARAARGEPCVEQLGWGRAEWAHWVAAEQQQPVEASAGAYADGDDDADDDGEDGGDGEDGEDGDRQVADGGRQDRLPAADARVRFPDAARCADSWAPRLRLHAALTAQFGASRDWRCAQLVFDCFDGPVALLPPNAGAEARAVRLKALLGAFEALLTSPGVPQAVEAPKARELGKLLAKLVQEEGEKEVLDALRGALRALPRVGKMVAELEFANDRRKTQVPLNMSLRHSMNVNELEKMRTSSRFAVEEAAAKVEHLQKRRALEQRLKEQQEKYARERRAATAAGPSSQEKEKEQGKGNEKERVDGTTSFERRHHDDPSAAAPELPQRSARPATMDCLPVPHRGGGGSDGGDGGGSGGASALSMLIDTGDPNLVILGDFTRAPSAAPAAPSHLRVQLGLALETLAVWESQASRLSLRGLDEAQVRDLLYPNEVADEYLSSALFALLASRPRAPGDAPLVAFAKMRKVIKGVARCYLEAHKEAKRRALELRPGEAYFDSSATLLETRGARGVLSVTSQRVVWTPRAAENARGMQQSIWFRSVEEVRRGQFKIVIPPGVPQLEVLYAAEDATEASAATLSSLSVCFLSHSERDKWFHWITELFASWRVCEDLGDARLPQWSAGRVMLQHSLLKVNGMRAVERDRAALLLFTDATVAPFLAIRAALRAAPLNVTNTNTSTNNGDDGMTLVGVRPSDARFAGLLSARLVETMAALFFRHLAHSGAGVVFVDRDALRRDAQFAQYLSLAALLRRVDAPSQRLKGAGVRLAFFVNVCNALFMHACVECGYPGSLWDFRYLTRFAAYDIGGVRMSLDACYHGVLRGNRAHPWFDAPPLPEGSVWPLKDGEWDPRVHFAVTFHTKLSPDLRVLRGDKDVGEQLQKAAEEFVASERVEARVVGGCGHVKLPAVLEMYAMDFVGQEAREKAGAEQRMQTLRREMEEEGAATAEDMVRKVVVPRFVPKQGMAREKWDKVLKNTSSSYEFMVDQIQLNPKFFRTMNE